MSQLNRNSAAKPALLYRLLEHPAAYALNQMINPWTVGAYHNFVRTKVNFSPSTRVLDIGCGLGAHKQLLTPSQYVGIDINPDYIAHARLRHGGEFRTMDAGALTFESGSFDVAVSVATCHHLSDNTIRAMISQVRRVLVPGGIFHIIDPVLPVRDDQPFKRWVFLRDRGQFQRTLSQMRALLASAASVAGEDLYSGPLHDVCYFALACQR